MIDFSASRRAPRGQLCGRWPQGTGEQRRPTKKPLLHAPCLYYLPPCRPCVIFHIPLSVSSSKHRWLSPLSDPKFLSRTQRFLTESPAQHLVQSMGYKTGYGPIKLSILVSTSAFPVLMMPQTGIVRGSIFQLRNTMHRKACLLHN